MRLFELFDDQPLNIGKELTTLIANSLAPLVASGVPHVSIDAVIDKLRQSNMGVRVDRAMALQLCDPAEMPFVKSIEGDKLILNEPSLNMAADTEEQAEKKKEKIDRSAQKHSDNEMKQKDKIKQKASPL